MSIAKARGGAAVVAAAAVIGAWTPGTASEPAPGKSSVAMSDALKSTQITIPVKDNEFKLGDIVVLAATDGSIQIQKASLLIAIRPVFREGALKAFEAKLPAAEYIDLAALTAAGLASSYNPADLELRIEPLVEQRPKGQITGSVQGNGAPADTAAPATLSGFLNSHFGLSYGREEHGEGSIKLPAVLLDGGLRWNGIVLEGEGSIDETGLLGRRATRLIYDLPDEAVRLSAGDLTVRPSGSFSTPPLLGVAITKSYSDLQPSRSIRPTGKRSFRIERPSDVTVLVNGREARRLRLAPGEYDLSDLPLVSGANDVVVKIKDEYGKEETVDFSILFNRTLLDPGISEWSLAGGVISHPGSFEPSYDFAEPALSAQYRRGLSENVTASLDLQTSRETSLIGTGAVIQTRIGLLGIDASASNAVQAGLGWSAGANLELDTAKFWPGLGPVQFGTEIATAGYAGSLDQLPAEAAELRLSGAITQPLPLGFTGSLSGHYVLKDNAPGGFGTSIAVNRLIDGDLTLGLSGSYEQRASDAADDAQGSVSLFARLNYRPSANSMLTLQRDGIARATTATLTSSVNKGDSSTSVDLEFENQPQIETGHTENLTNADLHYASTRFEADLSHAEQFERLGTRVMSRQTSMSIGTGIAFADDSVAFGRPVHGGFAIVTPHQSLSDSEIRLAPYQDTYKASSDGLGPLLFSDISAYARTNLAYDVDNLPPGYDLGSGSFDLLAPYRAGYKLSIGSDFAVTAMGVLKTVEGKPLPLTSGTVSSTAYPDKKMIVFTNAAGKFSAQGLKSGEWTIETNDDPPARYVLKIPDDASGYVELGELAPQK